MSLPTQDEKAEAEAGVVIPDYAWALAYKLAAQRLTEHLGVAVIALAECYVETHTATAERAADRVTAIIEAAVPHLTLKLAIDATKLGDDDARVAMTKLLMGSANAEREAP